MSRRSSRFSPLSAVRLWCFTALLLLAATPGLQAAPCRSESFEGTPYTVCSFDVREADLRVFWRNGMGEPYRTFSALADDLTGQAIELVFAMNGGMYGVDQSPIGLLVENGEELRAANIADGPANVRPVPNFYKKPNGVFYVAGGEAGVVETEQFLQSKPAARFATQSGPLLLIDGAIHPAFIEGSSDRKRRNGVGVSSPTEVHFVISEGRVNFHDFARFFRERLGCSDALFLDGGSAPGLYSPDLRRNDRPGHGGYGPIIAAVRKRS